MTKLVGRQIANGAIVKDHIAAGAGIETTKLAEGADFIKRDGSIPFTGNVSLGNQRITNLAAPTSSTDAATRGFVETTIANSISPFTPKGSVRVATTANITLTGAQTIDGVAVVAGERVLVKNQTTAAQNGVYVVAAGAWTRATDFDVWDEIPGSWVTVQEGTTQADSVWLATANKGGTLGTTAVTFTNPFANLSSFGNSNIVTREVPTGAINGTNTAFTLNATPTAGTEEVFLNGLLQDAGAGNDYTISGNTITMLVAPTAGEKILVNYRK